MDANELSEIDNNLMNGILDSRVRKTYVAKRSHLWRRCGVRYDMSEYEKNEFKDCDWVEGRLYFINRIKHCFERSGSSRNVNFCLSDCQKELLCHDGDMILTDERRSGVTTALAMRNVYGLVFGHDCHIGVVSRRKDFVELFDKVVTLLSCVPYYMMSGLVTLNADMVVFENGNSMVWINNARKKGIVANHLEFINCNFMKDGNPMLAQDTLEDLIPVVRSRNGEILVSETEDTGHPHSMFYKYMEGIGTAHRIHFTPLG